MRYINKASVHEQAVIIGRNSKNKMKPTANRLAKCSVDKQIDDMLSKLKPTAWELDDSIIIKGLAQRLWMDFLQTEVNLK